MPRVLRLPPDGTRRSSPSPAAPAVAAAAASVATAASPAVANQIPPSVDTKQRGRWLLHEAREQLHLGNYDMAQQKVDEAEALDVKWGLFDDTPAKVTEEIKKSRPKIVSPAGTIAANQPHDRRTARTKLHEARTALEQPPVRAGRSDRAGRQEMGTDLRPLRGQSRQGGRGGPCLAPPRQDPQHAAA